MRQFLVDLPTDASSRRVLQSEADAHDDVLLLPAAWATPTKDDPFAQLKALDRKVFYWLREGALSIFPSATHIGKQDLDGFVSPSRLVLALQAEHARSGADSFLYYGYFANTLAVCDGQPTTAVPDERGVFGVARRIDPRTPNDDLAACGIILQRGQLPNRLVKGCNCSLERLRRDDMRARRLDCACAGRGSFSRSCFAYAQGGFYALSLPLLAAARPHISRSAACVSDDLPIGQAVHAAWRTAGVPVQTVQSRDFPAHKCQTDSCVHAPNFVFKHYYYGMYARRRAATCVAAVGGTQVRRKSSSGRYVRL